MILEYDINPNCSETVYRIPKKYGNNIPKELLGFGSNYPTSGYSQMLPNKDTICKYFYQEMGEEFLLWLEENKIPYDTQQFLDERETWIKIKPTKQEKSLRSYGGSGDFYRRIPYRES